MAKGGKKDPAFLFYATTWLQSEDVRALTLAQRGAYVELLAFAWMHGSIPDNPRKLRAMLGVAAADFDELWADLAPLWVPAADEPGRLVNERQEHERTERRTRSAELRRRGQAGGKATADRKSQARATAQVQHALQHKCSTSAAPATLVVHPSTSTSSTPTPTPSAQNASAGANPKGEPEPDSDADVVALQDALQATKYRAGLPAWPRRRASLDAARRLETTGLRPDDVGELADLAQAKSTGDPGALLAHWLDENIWREVLDEQRALCKARKLRRPGDPEPDNPTIGAAVIVRDPKSGADLAAEVVGQLRRGR